MPDLTRGRRFYAAIFLAHTQQAFPPKSASAPQVAENVAAPVPYAHPGGVFGNGADRLEGLRPKVGFGSATIALCARVSFPP